ncbi:class I SAM-dependent methyltransferase [Mycolicibacterium frederiksbergense]|uniref:class I SAM-dependent methyltransferase n=1 Tax=Mycolicibacterium frederiksbergense TaxID=117567 RepID=UPI00265BCCE5|nr:class I SAM-dependent methyltransferase [Mycolicibacterium frederiksbergense]MDO0974572.1 class I SAM-dependent methyltransferase [Mycolicibacterium frederiksbergense]
MTEMPTHALFDEWDERYNSFLDQLPELRPNPVVITEITGRPTGSALDIGCGVGADAVWLAGQGWDVTALDVSQVALDRAAAAADQAGVTVTWMRSRLEDLDLPEGGFDLVTAHYPALLHSPGRDAERALLAAVAPGGLLLVVHHADIDVELAKSHGFDPAVYLLHDDVVALLGTDWEVTVDRRRLRDVPAGPEGQHTHDDVVLARRTR